MGIDNNTQLKDKNGDPIIVTGYADRPADDMATTNGFAHMTNGAMTKFQEKLVKAKQNPNTVTGAMSL